MYKFSRIILVIMFFISVCNVVQAKKSESMNQQDPSVQLLKQINDTAAVERENDEQITTVDVTSDTKRVKMLKKKYNVEFNRHLLKSKKNPIKLLLGVD